MAKRSNFPRTPQDKWATPRAAILPLLPQLPAGCHFAEPCAGNGALIDLLEGEGHRCVWASDVAPERDGIQVADALSLQAIQADIVITNPPWTRSVMHPLIDHLSAMLPCWFLFDTDWAYTRQSADLIRRCSKIVPIGRIKWIPDSKGPGFDNCCWYEFLPGHTTGPRLIPITAKGKSNASPKVPLVSARSDPAIRQDSSDAGSLAGTEIAGRLANGAVLHSMQSHQGRFDSGGMAEFSPSSSEMVARLRKQLRFVVQTRISEGDVTEG